MNELWALDGSNGQSSVFGFYDLNRDNYVDLQVSEFYYPSFPAYTPYVALPKTLNGDGTYAEIYDGNPTSITNYQKSLNFGFAPSPSKGLSPADIDGDAIPDWLETETVVDGFGNTATHLRLLRSSDGAVSWDSGPLPTASISVGAADMSGGAAYEIYYSYSPQSATWTTEALVLDGVSKAALWTRNLPRFSYLNAHDLTGDGKAELLVNISFVYTSGGNFQAFQGTNAYNMLWEANPGGLDRSFRVELPWDDGQDLDEDWEALDVDVDGDRDLVTVTNHYDLPGYPTRLHLRNAATFASDYVFPDLPNSSVDVQVEQIDGDPAYEIILSLDYASGVTSTVLVYDAATKALEWSYAAPAPMGRVSVGAFMDFNGDGTLDLTVAETGQNLLTSLSKARVYDAKNGYSLLYDSNPTNVIGFSSSFIGALIADGGDFWRLADLGNTGTLKFVQSDFFEGSSTSRVIEVPGYTELWNSGPKPSASGLLAMLADVHPGAGFELIYSYASSVMPPSTYHTRVYGCGGPPLTPSPTRTPAPPSATPSRTPTVTATFTPLPGSPTDSPTQSPSFTPSPSFTASPTLTPSATLSATPTVSPTPSVSPTQSATYTITPTFTPALYDASAGALAQLKPVFNPIRGDMLDIYVELGAPAEALDVELYSPAMVLIKRERISLGLAGARSRHRIDASGLAGGSFFARVAVQNAKGEAGHRVLRLYKVP